MAEEIVALRGGTRRYPGVLALDRADFTIAPGEVRALLGKNGAGKSTLIRMLTGAEEPDEGTVWIGGRQLEGAGVARTQAADSLGVRAVYQELSLVPGMSIAENMFLGHWPRRGIALDHAAMAARAREAMAVMGLRLDPRREVAALSTAEMQLVEIARSFMGTPRLVILDEPTSSLHAAEVDLVFRAVRGLAARGIAVIYVSHRMAEIREIADTATIIRDGRVIETLPVAEARTADIVRMMLGRAHAEAARPLPLPQGETLLSVRNLSVPPKLSGIELDLRAGEVLGIAGILGAGRTELLRAIAGLDTPASGTVTLLGRDVTNATFAAHVQAGLGFTPENRKEQGILPLLSVDENITVSDMAAVSDGPVLLWRKIRAAGRAIIDRLDIKASSGATPIVTLSGGNQQKAVIGRWLHARSRVLLLDEPTRGVDVESKSQIYAICRELAASGRAVIFVSSEAEELPLVCDRAIVLLDGRVTAEFRGEEIDADRLAAASMAEGATSSPVKEGVQ